MKHLKQFQGFIYEKLEHVEIIPQKIIQMKTVPQIINTLE